MALLALSNHYASDGKHKAIVYKSLDESRKYSVMVEGDASSFRVPFSNLSDAEDFAEEYVLGFRR